MLIVSSSCMIPSSSFVCIIYLDFIGKIGVLNFHPCDPLMYAFKHVEIRDTSSGFVYKARTHFKINFDHQFLLTTNEIYIIKNISVDSYIKKVSNGIIFMVYNS
jgi:hypothetical protein